MIQKLTLNDAYFGKKIHYFTKNMKILSSNWTIYIYEEGIKEKKIRLVGKWWHLFAFTRIIARFLRSDQYNIIYINELRELYILRDGILYNINIDLYKKNIIGKVPFRGIMHNAQCRLPSGLIIFGSYGNHTPQQKLILYIIDPKTKTMKHSEILTSLEAKHIHSVRWDTYSETIWVCTGDIDNNCHIIILNENLSIVRTIGDGSQIYRTCDFIFKNDSVIWAMDSPIKVSYIIKYDRCTNDVSLLFKIDGPGWLKVSIAGRHYLSIVSEPGESVETQGPKIMVSDDGEKWVEYLKYTKDFWPSIFKFGVCEIGSSDGEYFYINHQGSKEKDGVSEVYTHQQGSNLKYENS